MTRNYQLQSPCSIVARRWNNASEINRVIVFLSGGLPRHVCNNNNVKKLPKCNVPPKLVVSSGFQWMVFLAVTCGCAVSPTRHTAHHSLAMARSRQRWPEPGNAASKFGVLSWHHSIATYRYSPHIMTCICKLSFSFIFIINPENSEQLYVVADGS